MKSIQLIPSVFRRLPGSFAGAVLLGLLAAGLCAAQDTAASSDNNKKPPRKAKIVITDDDLPSHFQDSTPPAQADSASPQPDNAAPAPAPSGGSGSITVPGLLQNATVAEAEALLDKLKNDEQVMNRRYDQLQQKLDAAENSVQRQMYAESLSHRDETVGRKRKQIDDVESALREAKASGSQGDNQHAK